MLCVQTYTIQTCILFHSILTTQPNTHHIKTILFAAEINYDEKHSRSDSSNQNPRMTISSLARRDCKWICVSKNSHCAWFMTTGIYKMFNQQIHLKFDCQGYLAFNQFSASVALYLTKSEKRCILMHALSFEHRNTGGNLLKLNFSSVIYETS